MFTLVLLAHGLCLSVQPHQSFRAATAARTCRGGGPALCAPPPRPQVQGRPLREAVEGTMTDDLEVLDVEIGGETPTDFTALGMLRTRVAANLAAMNITAPNALQSACFGSLVGGRDAIVQAHTGSGKTIAFLLPIIEQLNPDSKEPQALVISPSRELAFQTARVAEQLLEGTGLSCVALSGGANPNRQMEKVRKARPQLLVGTPGRVVELAYEWQKLKLQRVRHLVVDEVDESFRPPYLQPTRRLLDSFADGRPLQLVFASATSDAPAVRRAASQLMRDPLMLRLARAAGRGGDSSAALPSTIVHGCVVLPQRKHMEALQKLARLEPPPQCLVFVNSPYRAKFVAQQLTEQYGTPAAVLFGEQEREERVDLMRRLLDGRTRLVVCTELGARGLDLPSLTHVVNYELPTDERHYVHRAGRCGRAGAEGTVLNLVAPETRFVVSKLAKRLDLTLKPMAFHAGKLVDAPKASRDKAPKDKAGRERRPDPSASPTAATAADAADPTGTAAIATGTPPPSRAAETSLQRAMQATAPASTPRKKQRGGGGGDGGAAGGATAAAKNAPPPPKKKTPAERAAAAREKAAAKRRAKA